MINKKVLMAVSVSALLLSGCFNSETGASQRAANGETEAHAPAKHEAKHAAAPAAEHAAPATEHAKAEAPAAAAPAASGPNLGACKGCHGADFSTSAMGKSKDVSAMSKADIVTALTGYKDGSYGGAMKGLMKGQVASFDAAAIEAVAAAITGDAPAAAAPEEKAAPAEEPKKEEAPAVEEPKAEEAAPVAAAVPNLGGCKGCHGADFEKKAMGKSKEVNAMSKADIATALKGYKDGSYGGAMKGLMKGQVAKYDDATLEAIANTLGK
jgi:cytochrome c-type protein NapB